MANIFCVEVLAIYENSGVAPTPARIADRDADFNEAVARIAAVGKATAPQVNEYLETFGSPSRYGTGWRCKQWISVSQDAITIGNAIWGRLVTRNLRDGTIVMVFPLDDTKQVYTTGPISFRRRLPISGDDIG